MPVLLTEIMRRRPVPADLPIGEASLDDVSSHQVEVGVLQNNAGVLAAQLHLHWDHARLPSNGDTCITPREAANVKERDQKGGEKRDHQPLLG
jgi:hypothetical protein